jgi:hypothetical protein
VESHPDEHLFLSCSNGTTDMRDARTGRLIRSLNTAGLGNCICRRIADDLTGRVFLTGATALGVLDARTGALVRSLLIGSWDGAAFELDGHAGGDVEADPRTGDVVVAPYVGPARGAPSREVLVLDGRSGAVLHRWAVPENPLALLMNPRTGHLLVTSAGPTDSLGEPLGDGTLSVLDMGRGSILRQVEVGIVPGSMFADRNAGRLLVVNYTTDLGSYPITRSYSDGPWPHFLRQLKGWVGWLPFSAPQQPTPPVDVTVTTLDLTKL